jgi:hypothetical protein
MNNAVPSARAAKLLCSGQLDAWEQNEVSPKEPEFGFPEAFGGALF